MGTASHWSVGRRAWVALVCAGIGSVVVACQGTGEPSRPVVAKPVTPAATDAVAERVERGKYLVTALTCTDCHTPFKMGERGPEPDMTRFLSGHPQGLKLPPPPEPVGPWIWSGAATNTAFAGPWGISYAINLTPHTHGMAAWDEATFIRAMRTGKHFGTSRPIQPPMPWQGIGQLTDADLAAVFAYLQTIPPIDNLVPDYQPPGK